MLKEVPAKVYRAISFEKDGVPDFKVTWTVIVREGTLISYSKLRRWS